MAFTVFLQAAAFVCVAPYFHDGDNIRCGGRQMRLARIDAPELGTGARRCIDGERPGFSGRCRGLTWGEESREHLRALVGRRQVTCTVVDATPRVRGFQPTDRFGRPVVRCSAEGVGDLGEAQVRAGHARPWP